MPWSGFRFARRSIPSSLSLVIDPKVIRRTESLEHGNYDRNVSFVKVYHIVNLVRSFVEMPIIGTGAAHLRDYNIRRITRGDSGVNRVYQNATAPILVIGAKNRLRQLNDKYL